MRVKRMDTVNNLEDYIQSKTGLTITELIYAPHKEYKIIRLREAGQMIIDAMSRGDEINWFTDYDVDGVVSAAIAILLMQAYGYRNYSISVPKRMSEGYGISEKALKRLNGKLLITVDNGIAAKHAIAIAKQKGMKVIIIDHHIAQGDVPEADLIIDPKAVGEADYDSYCGAGLIYKLAEQMLGKNHPFLPQIIMLAAIATIADVVPLTGDNRQIVKTGLQFLNNPKVRGENISYLMRLLKKEYLNSTDVSFYLAPALNAPGRLLDAGGEEAVQFLLQRKNVAENAERIFALNKKRKELVKKALDKIEIDKKAKINFIYDPDIPEGIVGIIAGKLTELNGKPSFIMTDDEEGNLKGSARNSSKENSIFDLLQNNESLLLKYGGHKDAGGFSLNHENLVPFFENLNKLAAFVQKENFFDFEVKDTELAGIYDLLQALQPFGEGMPMPILKVRSKITLNDFKIIGKDQKHVRFCLPNHVSGIAFGMANDFSKIKGSQNITFYGKMEANYFDGKFKPQFNIDGFEL